MSAEAKRQIQNVLVRHSNFPAKLFSPIDIDTNASSDSNIDTFLSMLVAAYYPNVCYNG